MTREVTFFDGRVRLYLGDCREILPTLGAVDLVVTSPPYAQQRHYVSFIGDDYSSLLGVLAKTPAHSHTQILVNFGLVHKDGYVIEYWEPFKRDMASAGWRFFGWYVWDQGPGMPGEWAGSLAPAHEFIFHFNKVSRRPNKTIPTKYAGYVRSKSNSGMRQANGEMSGWSHGLAPTREVKIPDSVIRVMRLKDRGGPEAAHPAVFPVELPIELVLAYSDENQTVLDPFMGSGTTGVAAVKLGRRFIGIEIEERYFEIACRRIEEATKQPDLFIETPAVPVQADLALEGAA